MTKALIEIDYDADEFGPLDSLQGLLETIEIYSPRAPYSFRIVEQDNDKAILAAASSAFLQHASAEAEETRRDNFLSKLETAAVNALTYILQEGDPADVIKASALVLSLRASVTVNRLPSRDESRGMVEVMAKVLGLGTEGEAS